MDSAHRCPLARLTPSLWCLANGFGAILPLAPNRTLAAGVRDLAATNGCRRQAELGHPFRRWECGPCASTCGRGKKGELNPASPLLAIVHVQAREALGWSKGGFSTKIHLRCDGNGLPMTCLLTVGERHEAVMFEPLMEQGAVRRPGRGRPRIRPKRVSGDKGYSSGKIRAYLRRRGIRSTIPRKGNERRRGQFDQTLYRQRNQVERCFNRLKQNRRIATRYEKKAENYLAMLTLASIKMWL